MIQGIILLAASKGAVRGALSSPRAHKDTEPERGLATDSEPHDCALTRPGFLTLPVLFIQ